MSESFLLAQLPITDKQVGVSSASSKNEPRADKDHLLLREISQGDERALKEFIGKWKKPIYAFFLRSMFNEFDAEDLTQKCFYRVFQASGRFQPKAKVSTWLFAIARNLLIDEIKKRARRPKESDFTEWEVAESERTNTNEIKEILSAEMDKLPENHRTALLLRVQQEWSYAEIAEMMNTHEANVKTWIYRARQVLKQKIKPQL